MVCSTIQLILEYIIAFKLPLTPIWNTILNKPKNFYIRTCVPPLRSKYVNSTDILAVKRVG
jgi:hypothetical protein